jgi:hypothetical protein
MNKEMTSARDSGVTREYYGVQTRDGEMTSWIIRYNSCILIEGSLAWVDEGGGHTLFPDQGTPWLNTDRETRWFSSGFYSSFPDPEENSRILP